MLNSFKHLVGKGSKEETQLKTYKNILEKDPQNVNIRLKLGDLYAKMGDKHAAIHEYTAAAVQYANGGYLVKAIAVNKIIVRLDPSKKEALDRLSDLYFQRGIAADPLVQSYRESLQKKESASSTEEEIEIPTIHSQEYYERDASVSSGQNQTEALGLDRYFKRIPLLSNLSNETQQWLEKHVTVRNVAADAHIVEPGDVQDSLFVILDGKASVFTKDKEDHDTFLNDLKAGSFFGGTSLFTPVRQTLSDTSECHLRVIAETTCLLLEIPKPILATLIKKEPDLSDTLLMEYYKQKTSEVTLARVPLFSYLDPAERRKIADHMTPINVRKGTTIITEGEIGDSMYVIKSGQVGVYTTLMEGDGVSVIKTDQERLHLATLKEGDFFGEQALITREPRSATIVSLTDVQLLKFTKHDLAVVVKHHPRVGTLLKKYHQQRITDTLESLKSIW
jgi:CRP-like cAMP-binding protein